MTKNPILLTLFALCLSIASPVLSPAAAEYIYLEPHNDNVVAARFTPDSQRIISLDHRGVLIEWDFLQDRIVWRRELGREISHDCAVLSPDGRFVLVADVNATVTLLDLKNGSSRQIPCTLLPKTGNKLRFPAAMAINDDATMIYLVDNYGDLYRSLDGKPIAHVGPAATSYSAHTEPTAMALSPDGKVIALSQGGTILSISTADGAPLATMRHRLRGPATRISFSADGKYLTAGIPIRFSAGIAVSEFPVWEVATGKLLQSLNFNDGLPFYAGFSGDGRYLFTAASKWSSIIERSSGKQIARFTPKGSSYFDMRESADGSYLLVAGSNGLLEVYDYRQLLAGTTPSALASLGKRRPALQTMAFSPDGASLMISFRDIPLQQFNHQKGKLEKSVSSNNDYFQLDFSKDGTLLFGFGRDGLTILRYPSLDSISQTARQRQADGILYSEDSSQALVLNSRYRIKMDWYAQVTRYDMTTGKVLKETVLNNPPANASMNHLLCADFTNNKAVFQMHNAFLYSLEDGSILQKFPYPPANEKDGLSDWQSAWRFDCAAMTFVPTTPVTEGIRNPSEKKWHYARSRDKSVTAVMYQDVRDYYHDRSVRLYDRHEKETGRFETFASPAFGGNSARYLALSDNGALLAVSTELGDVAIYETATGTLLGRYYFFADKEWAWVTADGTLHGSDKGKSRFHRVPAES